MKRAKIALTAIAVFAVVGGALAFKANKFGAIIYRTAPGGNQCTVTLTHFTLTANQNTPVTGSYAPVPGPCTTTLAYPLQ